jgi:hypothetical protein
MPGQVSNAEKAFRTATDTVGNISEIINVLTSIIPELKPIAKGGKALTNIMKTTSDITDLVQGKDIFEGDAIDKGKKIIELAERVIGFAGLDDDVPTNPLDMIISTAKTGFEIADIARSKDNTGNKVLRGIETVLTNFTPLGKAVSVGKKIEENLPIVYNSFAGNSAGIGSPTIESIKQMSGKFFYGPWY